MFRHPLQSARSQRSRASGGGGGPPATGAARISYLDEYFGYGGGIDSLQNCGSLDRAAGSVTANYTKHGSRWN
jgi:hypothetical protein